MKTLILFLISLFFCVNSFNVGIFGYCKIFTNNKNIYMYYEKSKDFNEPITILPIAQTKMIVDNWLNASIALRNIEREYAMKNKDINIDVELESMDNYISKNVYEFKVFMSINKNSPNVVYFSWIPDSHKNNHQVIYLIVGKILNNELQIFRIAQNPYAYNILDINSKDLLLDLYNFHKDNKVIKNINFNELHNHDKRYLLSWNFATNE